MFEINEPGIMTRINDKFKFLKKNDPKVNSQTQLFEIEPQGSEDFNYIPNAFEKHILNVYNAKASWIVFKGAKGTDMANRKQHRLNEGDYIKLGRVYSKVCKIHLQEDEINEDLNNSNMSNSKEIGYGEIIDRNALMYEITPRNNTLKKRNQNIIFTTRNNNNNNFQNKKDSTGTFASSIINSSVIKVHKEIKSKKKIVCRICYGDDDTEENPLIYPCKCSGSMKFIHFFCLRTWLSSKIATHNAGYEDDISISYGVKEIKCELCNGTFPDYIHYKNRYLNLSYTDHKYRKYIILDSIRCDKEKSRTISVINFTDKNKITLGRSESCDVSLSDLSVSRYHCFMFVDHGELYLDDNLSKFGSLVLLQTPKLKLIRGHPLKIQVSRFYFNLKMKEKTFSFFLCCSAGSNDNYSYYKQNLASLKPMEGEMIIENKLEGYIQQDTEENNLSTEENKNQTKDTKSPKAKSSTPPKSKSVKLTLIDNKEKPEINKIGNKICDIKYTTNAEGGKEEEDKKNTINEENNQEEEKKEEIKEDVEYNNNVIHTTQNKQNDAEDDDELPLCTPSRKSNRSNNSHVNSEHNENNSSIRNISRPSENNGEILNQEP